MLEHASSDICEYNMLLGIRGIETCPISGGTMEKLVQPEEAAIASKMAEEILGSAKV